MTLFFIASLSFGALRNSCIPDTSGCYITAVSVIMTACSCVCVCVCVCVYVFSSAKVYFAADTIFTRELDDGDISSIDAYFDTFPTIITRDQDVDIETAIQHFNKRVTNFVKRGSGYTLDHITKLVCHMVQYNPLAGSSFVPTPPWIERKNAPLTFIMWEILNVSNTAFWLHCTHSHIMLIDDLNTNNMQTN